MLLAPERHDRGWPKVALLLETLTWEHTARLEVTAMGRVDRTMSRHRSAEFITLLPIAGGETRVASLGYTSATHRRKTE